MSKDYHLGLLHLVHLLVSADGVIDETEKAALQAIKEREGIPNDLFTQFEQTVKSRKEREIYETGIDYLNKCTEDEKLRAFVILYKISEVDGRVHVKEVRLLLYSIKLTGVEFDDVISQAAGVPTFY